MITTNQFKTLAYLGSLSFLGSLILTSLGIHYRFMREVNPVTRSLFEINFFLPLLIGAFLILGISLPAYKIERIEEEVSKVTICLGVVTSLIFFFNFLREFVLTMFSLL